MVTALPWEICHWSALPCLIHVYWASWEKACVQNCSSFFFMMQDLPWLKIRALCNSRQAALYVNDSCSLSSSPTFDSLSALSGCETRFPSSVTAPVEQLFNLATSLLDRQSYWSPQRAVCIFHFALSLLRDQFKSTFVLIDHFDRLN